MDTAAERTGEPLLVPGNWWKHEKRKTQMFACKIANVEYRGGRYEFSIICPDEEDRADLKDQYVMLSSDVHRYVFFFLFFGNVSKMMFVPYPFQNCVNFRAKMAAY